MELRRCPKCGVAWRDKTRCPHCEVPLGLAKKAELSGDPTISEPNSVASVVAVAVVGAVFLVALLWWLTSTPPLEPAPSSSPVAGEWVTGGSFYGCRSKEWYDNFMRFSTQNDTGSIANYIATGKCIPMDRGVRVSLLKGGLATVKIGYRGDEIWLPREGITSR